MLSTANHVLVVPLVFLCSKRCPHRADVSYRVVNLQSLEMKVDNCQMSACLALRAPVGPHEFLNVNGPLQVGGSSVNLRYLASQFNWTYTPKDKGLHGCVRNFTFNGHVSIPQSTELP